MNFLEISRRGAAKCIEPKNPNVEYLIHTSFLIVEGLPQIIMAYYLIIYGNKGYPITIRTGSDKESMESFAKSMGWTKIEESK